MEEINIRKIKLEDIEKVAEIYKLAFNKATSESWTDESARKFINYWFQKQPDLFFITEANEEIVGGIVAGVKPYYDGNNLVDIELFVHPKFQGRKIAKMLLKELIEKAIEEYHITVVSGITYKTEFPLNWYRKIGLKKNDLVYLEGIPKEILSNL